MVTCIDSSIDWSFWSSGLAVMQDNQVMTHVSFESLISEPLVSLFICKVDRYALDARYGSKTTQNSGK